MANEVELTVPDDLAGQRMDKVLSLMLGVSRGVSRELLDEGVTVDGVTAKPGDRADPGVTIVSPTPREILALQPEDLDVDILYEDEFLAVVDKPAGMVVHPGSGRRTGTLAAGLLHRYPDLEGVGDRDRWGLIHRLDIDTSGTLLVALDQVVFDALRDQIRSREIRRIYTTLVEGRMGAATGTIDAPIGRDPARPTRRAVVMGGKQARTHFEVVRHYPDSNVSLLKVSLETGRTHQIRVHLAAVDHPIIGDSTYAGHPSRLATPRIFLHASNLAFNHPVGGLAVDVESPLPEDLSGVLDRLDMSSEG